VQPFGESGRLTISGSETEIYSGAEAALLILENLNSARETGLATQLGPV